MSKHHENQHFIDTPENELFYALEELIYITVHKVPERREACRLRFSRAITELISKEETK